MANDPSRTEAATPKRVNKARNKGTVHKSQEVTKTLTILGGLIGLTFWIQFMAKDLAALFRHFLSTAVTGFVPTQTEVMRLNIWLAWELAKMLLPILLFIGFIVYLALRLQVGKLWTTEPFMFKFDRFNPINGLKRMLFSMDTFIRLGKSLLQALCIGAAPWMIINAETPKFAALYYADASTLATYLLEISGKMVRYALVPMAVIAVADFFYTRWQYADNLKMTKSEIKEERRNAEGDPLIKAKQRQKMMQMRARRMMQDIPKADVVITNPTHIAVALRYNTMEAPAPVVLAMGADKIAEKIKAIARENGVPIHENKPLARALYKQVDIGDMIPEDLYQAVAAVLAQIWKYRPRKGTTIAQGMPGK
jgi:flagellar biosynthetic protein FlhB